MDGDIKKVELANFALNNNYEIKKQTTYQAKAGYALNDHAEFELRASFVKSDQRFADTAGLGVIAIAQSELEGEALLRMEELGLLERAVVGVIHNRAREDGISNPDRRFLARLGGQGRLQDRWRD